MLDKFAADPRLYGMLKEYAQQNRKNQTLAEQLLWQVLKGKGMGISFRRQFIIDQYIVDFVCRPSRLVIEVDGAYHSEPRQAEDDAIRTARLQQLGYRVIRFTNDEVLYEIEKVKLTIIKEI